MEVDGDVRRARLESRGLDAADGAERRQIRDVLRHVRPALAAVARHLNEAVVGAGPDHARLLRRLGNAVDDVEVLDTDVVGRESAGALLLALVVERQVRTDLLPALAAVGRLMDELAAGVDLVVIVRRDVERRVPDEAVSSGRPPDRWSCPARPRRCAVGRGSGRSARRCRRRCRSRRRSTR